MPLPACPQILPSYMDQLLKQLAENWAEDAIRPKFTKEIADHWDSLIAGWIRDPRLPLLIRKFNHEESRGLVLEHPSGKKLVPVDNSPAHWSFTAAYLREFLSINDVYRMLENDEIPIAMILGASERQRAVYKGIRSQIQNPNKLGWKICHKRPIGIRQRGSITQMPISLLEEHFRLFLSPSNMFVVPLPLSGLGEIPQVTEVMSRHL